MTPPLATTRAVGRLARPAAVCNRASRSVAKARLGDNLKARAGVSVKEATLYEQVGGAASVEAAVSLFYEKVYADERVAKWFDGVSKEGQLAKMEGFLTCVLKGHVFDGDLTQPHARLVVDGMSDYDFDVIAELFIATLEDLGVQDPVKGGIVGLVASTRAAVLGKTEV
ncbi:hypothetical protein BSKO_09255 [Bryopsis sp. KO-2023]|nr:hypothetical protein BSKO_09255 [Bryopsis sp. KO-2023]